MKQFTYAGALSASEKIHWRVEDIIGGDKRLDFQKPFLPESLSRARSLDFLSPQDRQILNQVQGHAYFASFGLVEEFILPFVLDHARPQLTGDDYRVRALLQFASEEAKPIQLFKRFRSEFAQGFVETYGVDEPVEVIGPPEVIAQAVLAHEPLSVALLILHVEWMSQLHFLDSVRDDGDLDSLFKSLLKHHWMEEAQHAKLDTLMVEALADGLSLDEIDRAIDGYLSLVEMFDQGFVQQGEFNYEAFRRASGRLLTAEERTELLAAQRQADRSTYLASGMTHPQFLATVERIRPGAADRMRDVASADSWAAMAPAAA